MIGDLKRAREEARRLAGDEPEEWGFFLWLENRLAEMGEPSTPAWWTDTLKAFWRTGKRMVFAGVGLRGLKSSVTSRAAVAEMLLRERKAVLGSQFVGAVLAASKSEAAGRVLNVRSTLRALTFREMQRKNKGEDSGEIVPPKAYAYSHNAQTGMGIIEFQDADGNMVAFWVRVAGLAGVREYTGVVLLCDEWDHVPVESEYGGAHQILDYGLARLSGQKGAHAYIVSNPTHERAALSAACIAGDGPSTFIARLGERGAAEAEKAFGALSGYLAWSGEVELAKDPRLHERQDPDGWRIPSCVARPIDDDGRHGAEHAIISHWKLACDSARRSGEIDQMGTFFRIYCARAIGGEGASYIDPLLAQEAGTPERDAAWAGQ